MDFFASSSRPLANNQAGDSGIMNVPSRKIKGKPPKTQARTYHSTKLPMMYVTQIPRANEDAVNEPSLPRILGEAHSLTYVNNIGQIIYG